MKTTKDHRQGTVARKETTDAPFFKKGEGQGFFSPNARTSNFFSQSGDPVQRKCTHCDKDLEKKEMNNGAKEEVRRQPVAGAPPVDPGQNSTEPLQVVYFARTNTSPVAIPQTATTVDDLVQYLVQAANPSAGDEKRKTGIDSAGEHLKLTIPIMNSLPGPAIRAKQHILLGQGSVALLQNVAAFTKGPIFKPDVVDPESELAKMGVSSLAEFFKKKAIMDAALAFDTILVMQQLNSIRDEDFPNRDPEDAIVEIMEKWIREPFTPHPINYPKGGEYFDKLLGALRQKTFILHNVFSDEWTSYFDLMFNRFIFRKSDIENYRDTYSWLFRGEQPLKEMSLWSDFAKPAITAIPGAIAEEAACFIEGVPLDITQDIGKGLHGVAKNYMDTVLPENGATNEQTLDIACTFGGVVFDMAGAWTKIAKVIQALEEADKFYKAYKEADAMLGDLPGLLKSFENPETIIDVMMALESIPGLDAIQEWVMAEPPKKGPGDPKPEQGNATPATGLEKFMKIIYELIDFVKKALKPVFLIRRKFQLLIGEVQQMMISHPILIKVLRALKEGKKIVDLIRNGDFPGDTVGILRELFQMIKESANEFIKGLGDQVKGFATDVKNKLIAAVSDVVLAEVKNIGGTVKAALAIPAIHKRLNDLISSKLTGPLLEKMFLDTVMTRVNGLIDGLTSQATGAIDSVIDGFAELVGATSKEAKGPVQRHESGNGSSDVPDTAGARAERGMAGSTGQGLAGSTKGQMEQAFGENFNSVKVHHDRKAQEASDELRADAFTRGSDIYFNRGKYDPNSKDGQRLLAHELTHVVQQGGGKARGMAQRAVGKYTGKLLSTMLFNFVKKKDPRALALVAKMNRLEMKAYDDPGGIKKPKDTKLAEMVLDKRKKMVGTMKDSFSRNIAAARIIVNEGKPNAKVFYKISINRPGDWHSEELMENIAYQVGPGTARIDQLYTERIPCTQKCGPMVKRGRREEFTYYQWTQVYYTLPLQEIDPNKETVSRKEQLMKEYGLTATDILALEDMDKKAPTTE